MDVHFETNPDGVFFPKGKDEFSLDRSHESLSIIIYFRQKIHEVFRHSDVDHSISAVGQMALLLFQYSLLYHGSLIQQHFAPEVFRKIIDLVNEGEKKFSLAGQITENEDSYIQYL